MTTHSPMDLRGLAEKAKTAKYGILTYKNDAEASISDADYEDWEEDVERFDKAATPEAFLELLDRIKELESAETSPKWTQADEDSMTAIHRAGVMDQWRKPT